MSDKISILVPTYNRRKFLPLLLHNIKSQDYPHDLLTLVIDDDGDESFIADEGLDEVRQYLYPIKLLYIKNKKRRNIGTKRNNLIKSCPTKIFCMMDDDDIYLPTYISYSYKVLKDNKYGCVGSDKDLFDTLLIEGLGCYNNESMITGLTRPDGTQTCPHYGMSDKNFDIHAIDCGNNKGLIHEASIMASKKWYNGSCKFASNSKGEGAKLFNGQDKLVGITDIRNVMICLQHSGNTVDKMQFARKDNKLEIKLSDELKEKLKIIL